MYIQTKSKKKTTSEVLAIIAMAMLLTYIADAAIAHGANKKGFLPMSAAQRGIIFGISTIILFLLSFAIGYREKSKITTILLIIGGALIGTSILASSAMAKGGLAGIQSSFTGVIIIGYIIMGLGILRVVQKK
ncbi:MAG TPA: hypothetical protein VE619_11480 [Nitrososphaeraceae archaeon]|nr:hypothetical protein [Nitrososphaeraceae archaeon]